jgi:hypothetical protein
VLPGAVLCRRGVGWLVVASTPSIGLRSRRSASPWPADGSHRRCLASHEGCSHGRFLEVMASPSPTVSLDGPSGWHAPWPCCGSHGAASSHPGGLWLGGWPSSPFWWCSSCGGSMSKLGRAGAGGRVPSGGACWCVAGAVRPFVQAGGTRVSWRRLAARDLSTTPPMQVVSWRCVVSSARFR